ncbi:hypothetical protein ACLBKS_03310 [Hylemonella sp. W303a]|uniref:hypothetical protein n=1 Tax=Hylemonella sp. W303a TaxID=3389873 RepID=UPI00396B0910
MSNPDLPSIQSAGTSMTDGTSAVQPIATRKRAMTVGPVSTIASASSPGGRQRAHSFTQLSTQQRSNLPDFPLATVPAKQEPVDSGLSVEHPDFLGYTGHEHQFKTPVRAGPFKFSVVGQISPDIARLYGLETTGADAHQGRSREDAIAHHERMQNPDFFGYTGRDHEFKTPVRAGPFTFSVVGSIAPEVARQHGLDQAEAGDHVPGRAAHDASKHEAVVSPASQGKTKLGFGTPIVGGVFGEIVMARLAKRAMKRVGEAPAPGGSKTGDAQTQVAEPGQSASASHATEHKDFLGFTGREHEFKTPVHMGPFKFSVIGNVSPEVARHYGIDHLGFEGRSHADHTTTTSKAGNAAEHGAARGKFRPSIGPAKIGGVFGEIVTAKLAQRAMKKVGNDGGKHSATGAKSGGASKAKPGKFKLSVTPRIGGLLGDKVTAKLALRARKQAAKSTSAPSSTAKKTS